MEPLLVLVALPVLIGAAAELAFRDARRASLAASLCSLALVFLTVRALDSGSGWGWLAALLVSPLPISLAIATVLVMYGHQRTRPRHRGNGA